MSDRTNPWSEVTSALVVRDSRRSRLAIGAAFASAIGAWLAMRFVAGRLGAPDLPLHVALWGAWLLWLGLSFPGAVARSPFRRTFALHILTGASLTFAQMIWPVVAGLQSTGGVSPLRVASGGLLLVSGLVVAVIAMCALGPSRLMFVQESPRGVLTLSTSSIYGRIRHPALAGSVLASLGAGLAFGALDLALVNLAVVPAYVVLEDRRLVRAHGDAYEVYRRSVPAILPGRARV